ncbi:hypothetical protein DDE18_04880 [Nocardioides gansuensis]|uniref:Gram-positive cocci surface proteins LPxTG domain-containing protein n=1 Tax=Nocardioides gansuensis TaxID=2138300 RepID=A0A2T8FD84_9ACTN|nr:hypothetical protein [Nocardioides gansuensis]PVG83663.1 hypothetical protein DDE18_04880 [Nocardioides gansuensis]
MTSTMQRRSLARVGAGLAALALGSTMLPAFAAEEDGEVAVTNTETVQVYLAPTGEIETRRVYEQLTLSGDGTLDLENPVETAGLRNLDGFGTFEVDGGLQRGTVSVDGVERFRSVSDYRGDLPLEVEIEYRLDGERVEADDVVGADGLLEVFYTVRNITSEPQEITFTDGAGSTVTESVDVPIPMVGSVSTVLPANFTDVETSGANMAGDGKGGTKLTFTMTLVPPLGEDTVRVGYQARVSDATIPAATVSALPVNPLASPAFKSAASSYEAGSQTGEKLAAGATEIDSNLLKLRDGTGELILGLIQLRNGASQLRDGLAGRAAPGAAKLATGAGALRDGLTQIDSGADRLDTGAGKLRDGAGQLGAGAEELKAGAAKLDAGAKQLHTGTGTALAGSMSLTAGLSKISSGLKTLGGEQGLGAAGKGIDALQAGVDQLLAGFGSATQDGTLLYALNALSGGLGQLEGGAGQLAGGLGQLRGDAGVLADPADGSGLAKAKNAVDVIKGGLDESLKPGGSLDQLVGGLTGVKTAFCSSHPTLSAQCAGTVDQLIAGVGVSRTNLGQAAGGLGAVSGGLGQALGALDAQLVPGAQALHAGLIQAKTGATKAHQGGIALKDGVAKVGAGLTQLESGLATAISGVLQLSTGATAAYTGSSALTEGLGKLSGGTGELATGTGKLAAGSGKLSEGADKVAGGAGQLADGTTKLADGTQEAAAGSARLADGATELSTGLGEAASGSGRLADGLARAASGAPAIRDGAGRLSKEGMSKLIGAGEDTAMDYGKLAAIVAAGSERAEAEAMAYGAPQGAQGLTAYSFEIRGDTGEGGRNVTRGVLAGLLLAAGLGVVALRRRIV